MKRFCVLLLLLVVAVTTTFAATKIKVACIGNSITFGHGIKDRDVNSYPAQLQQILGEEYEVKNFGVSSRTTLFKGNFPYVETTQYKESLAFEPDIVIIKLGTNDSKEMNMKYVDEYEDDYQKIIDSYAALSSTPRIILVTPLKCYHKSSDRFGISDRILRESITPKIFNVAYKNGLEVINGQPLCGYELDLSILPDKLHPSAQGATMMAEHFAEVILADRDSEFDIFKGLDDGEEFSFYGYKGMEYKTEGLEFKVVQPKVANSQRSWVIRARFWGHEPQVDQRLLEMGFHIAYCDVANLFGSAEAVKRWDRLYDILRYEGLSKKVVLEGMSRGGLIVYNWAVENRKKVSAIYADAPVMDLKSWPMGDTKYTKECNSMKEAYGMSEEQMLLYEGNPVDHAKRIAKSKIKIMHVIGDADDVVPYSDNTARFAESLRGYGGEIEIIIKEGIGHHPHSLKDPKSIADFILRAEGL
ncbi:MAG: GDSL-type esterase/lipase family protein [Rikenellaceae bacterium]